MTPEALILFYQPNHIYKNKKYLLSLGNNFIGSDPSSQIFIEDKTLPAQAAAIRLRNDMLTLLRLDDIVNVVVESNLLPKKKICLEKNVQYILVPDKQFQIGRWRGLFKIITQSEARDIKGVVNKHLFNWDAETKKDDVDIADIGHSLIDQIPEIVYNNKVQKNENRKMQIEIDLSATLVLPEYNMEPTLVLAQDEADGQTEKLQQSDKQYQMPQTLLQKSPRPSQQKYLSTNSKLNKEKNVKENTQVRMIKTLEAQNQSMPATLEDVQHQKQKQKQMKPRAVNSIYQSKAGTRSSITQNVMKNSMQIQNEEANTCPEYLKKSNTSNNMKKTGSYQDILFGFASNKNSDPEQLEMINRESGNSLVRSGKPTEVSLKLSQQKSPGRNQQMQIKKSEQFSDKKEKRVAITGFKLNDMQKYFMSKRNMRLIQKHDEDYDLLVIAKQPKITKRLLEAIIKGIEVQTEAFLTGDNGQIFHQFMGISWKQITSKQSRSKLYKDKKVFLSETLHIYRQIIQLCGGIIVEALSKTKGYIMLFVVPQDVLLYKQYKTYKTKGFYNQTMLQRSILTNTLPESQIEEYFFK